MLYGSSHATIQPIPEIIARIMIVRKVYLNRAKDEGYFVVNTDDIIEIVQSRIQNIVIEKLVQEGIQIKN